LAIEEGYISREAGTTLPCEKRKKTGRPLPGGLAGAQKISNRPGCGQKEEWWPKYTMATGFFEVFRQQERRGGRKERKKQGVGARY